MPRRRREQPITAPQSRGGNHAHGTSGNPSTVASGRRSELTGSKKQHERNQFLDSQGGPRGNRRLSQTAWATLATNDAVMPPHRARHGLEILDRHVEAAGMISRGRGGRLKEVRRLK